MKCLATAQGFKPLSTDNPPPLPGQTSRDVVSGSFVGDVDVAKLAHHRKRPGWPTWTMWIWLTFFCWIGWWPTCSLGLGATLTSSSLSLLFGNINRTGFSNTMILLGPWPKHFQFKKPSAEVQLKPRIGRPPWRCCLWALFQFEEKNGSLSDWLMGF